MQKTGMKCFLREIVGNILCRLKNSAKRHGYVCCSCDLSYSSCRMCACPWRRGPFFHPPAVCSGLWNCAPWSPCGSSPAGRWWVSYSCSQAFCCIGKKMGEQQPFRRYRIKQIKTEKGKQKLFTVVHHYIMVHLCSVAVLWIFFQCKSAWYFFSFFYIL